MGFFYGSMTAVFFDAFVGGERLRCFQDEVPVCCCFLCINALGIRVWGGDRDSIQALLGI